MPRDSAGNYTLPPGNPVASGEIISANWANTTMDDLGEALSASLDRYGRGGMLAPFSFADGTVSAPGATWANEPTTGFFRNGYGDLQVTITGQQMQKWTPNKSYLWRDDGEGNVGWDEILTASSTGGDITFESLFVKNDLYVNTNQFVVDSVSGDSYFGSGNVGIGTDTVDTQLVVEADTQRVARFRTTGSVRSYATFADANTTAENSQGFGVVGDDIKIWSGNAERLTIAQNGNVGISAAPTGITSYRTLDIVGGADVGGALRLATTEGETGVLFNYNGSLYVMGKDNTLIGTGDGTSESNKIAYRIDGGAAVHRWFDPSDGTTERMRIDANGNVGINGTPDSGNLSGAGGAKLQVDGDGYFSGTVSAGGMALSKKDGTIGRTGASGLGLYFEGGSNNVILPTDGNGDLKSNGPSLGNGTRNFNNAHFSGTVNAGAVVSSGNVTAFSDVRLKEDIRTLDGSKVFDMRGVSFTKDGAAGSGVIAQELQQVAPELVNEDGEYLSVAYGNVVGYLIEAVKGLNKRIEELEHGAT